MQYQVPLPPVLLLEDNLSGFPASIPCKSWIAARNEGTILCAHCGICSYHAHASSSSKGSSCARIRKEHHQGIGVVALFPRNEVYATYPRVFIWNPIFAPHCCYPLGFTFFILRKTVKMNARTFNETITASNCSTSLAHTYSFWHSDTVHK